MDAESPPRKPKWVGWWIIWALALLVSLAPPLVHHFRKVPEILEPFRYAWGFMPADLIILRELGEKSQWIPVALIALLIIAICRPTARRAMIASGACLSAGFSAMYASYCLLILTTYLPSYSNAMNGRTDVLQAFYVRNPSVKPGKSPLDGVYAHGYLGDFERETIVLEGNTFQYWFSSDEAQPNIFPLSGTFVREKDTLQLTYSISGTSLNDIHSIFPPVNILLETHSGVQTLKTVRFTDPFDPGPELFLTTVRLSADRKNFPVIVEEEKIVPELREYAKALDKEQ